MQYLHENTCVGVSSDRLDEYCEIFKDSYYEEHLQTAASGLFLSRKTDLLNTQGLCGKCSITYVQERKICSQRV